MIDHVQANEYLDIYGPLLTARQQDILSLYYGEDLSYTEISEELGISRAGVMDTVHRASAQVEKYEHVIGKKKKKHKIIQLCQEKKYNEITNVF